MRKYKRIITLLLTLSMSSCLSISALAQETISHNNVRVEDAVVDVSSFDTNALTYVETYVVENSAGQFYISDEAALRSLLTEQQYALIEKQIQITNENSV